MRNAREELSAARAMSTDGQYVPIYGSSHLCARATRKEAEEYYHYIVHDLGDWTDMDNMLAQWLRGRTVPIADTERLKERLISGVGTFLAIGSYDDVVETYRQLHEAGLDGIAVGMFDYIADTERLRDEIGLRIPVKATV